jgi:hypothetical protein
MHGSPHPARPFRSGLARGCARRGAVPAYRPDPDKVRARLRRILAEARAAKKKLPWEPARVSLYRTIFPHMTNWLPEEEGAKLRRQFEAELVRLEAA